MKPLTRRQTQIVALLGQGLTAQEAARRLGLRYSTIRHSLQAARERTGCQTTVQLMTIAKLVEKTD